MAGRRRAVRRVVLATPGRADRRRCSAVRPRRCGAPPRRRSSTPTSSWCDWQFRPSWPERLDGPQRLPRAQAGPALRHGGVVRLAEVGPLAGRRRLPDPAGLARPRRAAGPAPRRRRGARSHRRRDVGRHLGVDVQPTEVSITRWPDAFPQYRPHHAERVAAIEAALPADACARRGQLPRHRHPGVHRRRAPGGGPRQGVGVKGPIVDADGCLR